MLDNCSEADPSCGGTGDFICIYRYVLSISNPNASGYKNALRLDDDLSRGIVNYKCYPSSEVEALLATDYKKNQETTVTSTYKKIEIIPPPDISDCMVNCIDENKYWCAKANSESGKCCGTLPS